LEGPDPEPRSQYVPIENIKVIEAYAFESHAQKRLLPKSDSTSKKSKKKQKVRVPDEIVEMEENVYYY
jgi:hypothetical protein